MSLRTPLGRVLGHGSAKDGTDHFVSQRISAIALAILGLWFLYSMLTIETMTYLDVFRFLAQPLGPFVQAGARRLKEALHIGVIDAFRLR